MITINISKAKLVGHDLRRQAREAEFKPLDEIIMKQIPGKDSAAAEASRQLVREKYAEMQTQIDLSASVDEIKAALGA